MYAEVLVELTNKNVDKTFTYHVPDSYQSKIQKGIRVEVPFQKRTLEGFVLNLHKNPPEYDTKDILRIIDEEVILTEELFDLGKYLKKMTLASLISCYQAMLPKALKAKKGVEIHKKYESYIKLEDKNYIPTNEKQQEILDLLKKGIVPKKRIQEISDSSMKTLLKKNVLSIVMEEVYRGMRNQQEKKEVSLTIEQKRVIEEIEKSPSLVHLLHGVTGSGKTEVYIALIEKMIKNHQQVIVLVPEISLTEQITSRFLERFDRIAVLHSRLSDGEKYDEYRRIKKGEVDIVIGPRSAVFAPLKNIGMIILDEEQSTSFKQDHAPRYKAIDVAIWRMQRHHGKVLLGSATPSLEVYARCLKKVYGLSTLSKRVNQKALPQVLTVDMNQEIKHGNSIFSSILLEKITQHLEINNQVLLLLNRRGYSSFLSCKNCGHVIKCPNCDITLTYHKSSNTLRCHYCGYGTNLPKVCPECREESLQMFGTGTEKIEEKLASLFPNAKILRMDLDTTSKKGMHEKMIRSFKNHEYDILLGTQIVAKGLDFPLVTLVGVINADTSLNIPDFRSSEDTFQLLSQVAGRSGRGSQSGEVVIQTFNPDHYAILYAKNHDYLGFFKQEMIFRKKLGYPPYYYLTTVLIKGQDFKETQKAAYQVGNFLKEKLTSSIVLGPVNAAVSKIQNTYRFQILIKYKKEDLLYKTLLYLENHYKGQSKIQLDIDFNPNHF